MSEERRPADQDASGRNIAQAKDRSFAGVQVVNVYQGVRPEPVDAATLAAADALLASLPLDAVPSPAPLPPGSRLPHARNPLFIGRERDLSRLATVLKGSRTAAIGQIAAATGLGGIGKTQLAVEFAHRYGRYFAGGAFWLSCADPAVVPAEVAACGAVGGLDLRPDFASLKQDDQIALVLAAWQSPLPRLLVFDNCEDPDLLSRWRPPTGGARVLVTSRRSSWDPALGVEPLSLDILPRAESVALLRKFRPQLAAEDLGLDAICKELGDLPLALHLAGSYLYELRFSAAGSPAALLADLQSPALLEHPALQGLTEGRSPTGHERHVARTFALSFGQLDAEDPRDALAIRALARAARFAPGEPIPRDLLKKTFATAAQVEEELAAERALQRLNDLGLLETDAAGALRLHRLLARFVDTLGADPEAAGAVEEALFAEANRINLAGFPAPLRPWLGHLRHVAAEAESRGGELSGSLWNELGYHLHSSGAHGEAKAAFARALRIDEAALGPDHPNVANRVNNLGGALKELGKLRDARAAFERALRIYEAALGPDHPQVAICVNNLGSVLRALGDLRGARTAYERALRIDEAALGPDHPNVAIRLNNLGNVLRDLGDRPGARAAYERVMRIDKVALGPDHPDAAITFNNLGNVLRDLGDFPGARAACERAVQIFEAALGPDHSKTRLARKHLAALRRPGS